MDPAGYALERISMAELAVQALAQEHEAARAEIEQCILNMATISTIACKQDLDWYPTEQTWERPALRDVVRLVSTLKEARAEIERLKAELAKAKEAP